jgi:hypothetical protein
MSPLLLACSKGDTILNLLPIKRMYKKYLGFISNKHIFHFVIKLNRQTMATKNNWHRFQLIVWIEFAFGPLFKPCRLHHYFPKPHF